MVKDPVKALEDIIAMGIERVLTSGTSIHLAKHIIAFDHSWTRFGELLFRRFGHVDKASSASR
jgi:hypothetical protein